MSGTEGDSRDPVRDAVLISGKYLLAYLPDVIVGPETAHLNPSILFLLKYLDLGKATKGTLKALAVPSFLAGEPHISPTQIRPGRLLHDVHGREHFLIEGLG